MTSLCITHRVDEDISWVEDIYGDLLIYNKGDEWDLPYVCYKSPKILNEVDTFLRGIIEAYDVISNYRYIYLLRPDCKKFDADVISYVNINQYNQVQNDQIVPLADKFFDFNIIEAKKTLDDNQVLVLDTVVEIMKNFGIDLENKTYSCAFGSQYFFNSGFILNKPKEWWITLHQIAMRLYENFGDNISYIFEILWPLILRHSLISE